MQGKKTLSVSVAGFVGALVFLIMHYTGDAPLDPAVVSMSWTTVVWTAVMFVMRVMTTGPAALPKRKDKMPEIGGDGGWTRLDIMLVVCLILMAGLSLLSAGCAAHQVCPDGDGVVTMVRVKAPSYQTARCSSDPETRERLRLDGNRKGTMLVRCPVGQVPGPAPGSVKECGDTLCTTSVLDCVTP